MILNLDDQSGRDSDAEADAVLTVVENKLIIISMEDVAKSLTIDGTNVFHHLKRFGIKKNGRFRQFEKVAFYSFFSFQNRLCRSLKIQMGKYSPDLDLS